MGKNDDEFYFKKLKGILILIWMLLIFLSSRIICYLIIR